MTTIREYKSAFERQGWMTRQDAARVLRMSGRGIAGFWKGAKKGVDGARPGE